MAQRKKLLFITDVFPFPFDRGQHVRIWNLLAACGRAYDVTFIGPPPVDDDDRHEVEQFCTRVFYLDPQPASWRTRALRIGHTARIGPGIPSLATMRRHEAYIAALNNVRTDNFDLIWAERLHIARLCGDFRKRTIIDLDDIEHIKIWRRIKARQQFKIDLHEAYRYLFFRHLELSWSRRFLASVVCSENDRKYLNRHGRRNTIVVPNAPNARAQGDEPLTIRMHDRHSPLRVVFLGNVDSIPNADAIAFFADEILPKLRARIPDAILDVIGQGATVALRDRYASRVRFRGFVENLGEALAEYDVMVAPLRFGSGTKLKNLDSMAHGLPVVTTSVGAEGLQLKHGENAWLAETATEFVDGIRRIKDDPVLAHRLATNAYALVRNQFSWDAIQKRLAEWLVSLEPQQ